MDNKEKQIRLAGQLIATGIDSELKKAIESQFPELKENKNERIRQMIKNTLRDAAISERISETSYREMSDYLEKQKEQKPTERSEEEEKDIQEASDYLRDYANNCVQGGNSKLYIQSLADRIESLRPQPHWKPTEE